MTTDDGDCQPPADGLEPRRTKVMTLEAMADTIIPGAKRWPADPAIAGVSAGGGAVDAGALALLEHPAGGIADLLDGMVESLNGHALRRAADHDLTLDDSVPPFVALPFADRTAVMQELMAPGHPEKALWVALAMFSNMAFDSAAHLSTTEALANGHPGLIAMGFEAPNADGIWRFPSFSYRRALARLHPDTTSTGSPA